MSYVKGVLQPNLPTGTIDLSIGLQPDAVLRHIDYPDYQLPETGHAIGQIFTDMNGELLILGNQGSGKTILLLQLAEYLLGVAQHDEMKPIPVIFNLASWGRDKKPLNEWLIDELQHGYGVPRKTGKNWVKNNQLTLLLDGLDEIAPSVDMMHGVVEEQLLNEHAIRFRSDCIAAINTYRQDYANINLVVCSRIKDYNMLQSQLDLNAAILLKDLTQNQVHAYLKGPDHAGTRELLQHEATAETMAKTPFLLNMMKTAYADIPY